MSGIYGITNSTDGYGEIPIGRTYGIINSTVRYGEIPISGIFPNEWDYKFNRWVMGPLFSQTKRQCQRFKKIINKKPL